MIVSQLCVYPLKSAQGISLQQAQVTTKGFLWDRELMLISGSGKFITQRQFPQLAQVQVAIGAQNIITLSSSNNLIPPLSFPSTVNGSLVEVEIWRDRILAIDQGDAVAQWFHQLLNLPSDKVCRLVRQSANQIRLLSKKYPGDEDQPLGFADNSPVMLTASASLTELNQRIMEIHQQQSQAIPMNRFRANIVIDTTEPFVEDSWSLIQIGEVEFEVTKPCSRCIITTIDQQQGEKNHLKEPLNALGTFRQLSEQGVMFGVNMIPQNEGTISIGDQLIVLKTRD
ncbi:MAG: MOSC N-terminal beta barrel domain-containing protein [Cyanobacteria bacterium P01_G01_bin.39]